MLNERDDISRGDSVGDDRLACAPRHERGSPMDASPELAPNGSRPQLGEQVSDVFGDDSVLAGERGGLLASVPVLRSQLTEASFLALRRPLSRPERCAG